MCCKIEQKEPKRNVHEKNHEKYTHSERERDTKKMIKSDMLHFTTLQNGHIQQQKKLKKREKDTWQTHLKGMHGSHENEK